MATKKARKSTKKLKKIEEASERPSHYLALVRRPLPANAASGSVRFCAWRSQFEGLLFTRQPF